MRHLLFLAAPAALIASSPAWAADPKEETVHVVAEGETLNGIANRAGVSAAAIITANALKAPGYPVRVGQKLAIPRKSAAKPAATKPAGPATSESVHVVGDGETLGGIANRAGVSRTAIAQANGLKGPDYAVRVGQKLTIPRPGGTPAASASATKTRSGSAKATAPELETRHVVTEGETLGGIAARAKVPRVLIIEANGLKAPYDVRPGQILMLPRTRRHTVAQGETGFTISYKYGVPWDKIAVANGIDATAAVKPGQELLIPTLLDPPTVSAPAATPSPQPSATPVAARPAAARFAWPVAGNIRREYATGADYHNGIDITAPKGTMVQAAAAGTVKFAGLEKEQYGNLVVLDHGDGWFTAYGFLSRVTVKDGAKVAAGERIGLVGNTGQAKGNELHFEIRKDGNPIDPRDQLPKAQ
ncbi:LysM peptidoglycan-binding domain-containing protein [Novosphingobium colocasiae]|uniref:LysM domain-containing protein n=1 Tax=Novosphingobium colocasiae TaxID=1256513 RepID=A0A918UGQ5_9SPHN|nr:LysM peptidoglycan-binding domain-containing protein [Novosphingobium colocasiae]GGZ06167.1 hypothetical protein GCM10011614_21330 [Novosphingobium colocasiae]